MKNEIKKSEVLKQTFISCNETVVLWEALNDAIKGQFVKLKRKQFFKTDRNENLIKDEIIKRKVYSNDEGVYVSF